MKFLPKALKPILTASSFSLISENHIWNFNWNLSTNNIKPFSKNCWFVTILLQIWMQDFRELKYCFNLQEKCKCIIINLKILKISLVVNLTRSIFIKVFINLKLFNCWNYLYKFIDIVLILWRSLAVASEAPAAHFTKEINGNLSIIWWRNQPLLE